MSWNTTTGLWETQLAFSGTNPRFKISRYANNWELSAMRAAQIATMMVDDGMDPSLLRTISYAGNRPLVPNLDAGGNPIPENRSRNQRIVIRVEKPAAVIAG